MKITAEALDRLLFEDESTTLDFKRDQYLFEGASNEQKSELLKDILAFANAWRRAGAYILIGVEHRLGAKSYVYGVTEHLDDAKLQQFISSKTQRPIEFSYQALEYDGRRVGVIHIPCQTRPVYLRNDFGKLKKNAIYLRRGSSTSEADLEEAFKMREEPLPADTHPALMVQLGDDYEKVLLNQEVRVRTINWEVNKADIPVRDERRLLSAFMHNPHYYEELVVYRQATDAMQGFSFAVTNDGGISALGVVVELEFDDPGRVLTVHSEDGFPSVPRPTSGIDPSRLRLRGEECSVQVQRTSSKYLVNVDIGKVRPRSTVWSRDRLCLGTSRSQFVVAACVLRADNLPEPVRTELRFQIEAETKPMNVGEIIYAAIHKSEKTQT